MPIARSPWEVAADIIDPLPDPYVNHPGGGSTTYLAKTTSSTAIPPAQ
jgi:hypothetical protein